MYPIAMHLPSYVVVPNKPGVVSRYEDDIAEAANPS